MISSGKRGATEPEPTPDEAVDYTPTPENGSFTKAEPAWEEMPVYKIDAPKNNMVETQSVHEETAEYKIKIVEKTVDKVGPASKEITGYMIDAENNDFIPEKPVHTKNETFIVKDDDTFDEDTPIQKEMLRYVFGPYRSNNEDKETGNRR